MKFAKVMFLHVSVSHSVHGGAWMLGGHGCWRGVCGRGACVPRGRHAWHGRWVCVDGGMHVWMGGGMHGQDGCVVRGGACMAGGHACHARPPPQAGVCNVYVFYFIIN